MTEQTKFPCGMCKDQVFNTTPERLKHMQEAHADKIQPKVEKEPTYEELSAKYRDLLTRKNLLYLQIIDRGGLDDQIREVVAQMDRAMRKK